MTTKDDKKFSCHPDIKENRTPPDCFADNVFLSSIRQWRHQLDLHEHPPDV